MCLAVLATRVPLEFERVRFRIVTAPTPALGQSLPVSLPELSRLAGSPAAVIMRLRGGPQPTGITLALNGTAISNVVVPPNRDIRVDASMDPPAGSGNRLLVTGNGEGWQVTYLEIANVHGFSRGLLGFDIVPRERTNFRRVPWWILVLLLAALLALRPQPRWPPGATWRRAYRAGQAVVLILFVTVVLADRVTQFKILLSVQTFLLCVAVLYAQRTTQACRVLWRLAIAFFWRALAIWRTTARAVGRFAAKPWVPAALAGAAAISASVMALALGAHYAGGADSYRLCRAIRVVGPRATLRRSADRERAAAWYERLGCHATRLRDAAAFGRSRPNCAGLLAGSAHAHGRLASSAWAKRGLPGRSIAGGDDDLAHVRARPRTEWWTPRVSLPHSGWPRARPFFNPVSIP